MRTTARVLAILLAPSLALVSCGQQQEAETGEAMEMAMTVDMEALTSSLAEGRAAFEAAYEEGDAAALAAMWAEDGVRLIAFTEVIRGTEAVRASFAELFENTANRTLQLQNIADGGSGDLAYTVGTYTLSHEMNGEAVTDEGKYLMVLRQTPEGEWKIVAAASNPNQPAH